MAINEKTTTVSQISAKGEATFNISEGSITISDPKIGDETITLEKLAEHFDGFVIDFKMSKKAESDEIE